MATSKTTDLSTVDQLTTLDAINSQIDCLQDKLSAVVPILSCYYVIRLNEDDTLSSAQLRLRNLFDEDTLNDIVGSSLHGIKATLEELCDLKAFVEKNMFNLRKGALK
ncbi:hypothetical protein [Vibrio vulnificus]|uniref:hypothetical protein n=1 Tax=Vibrio vulnificus TaxID=672 RepID=UPI00102C6A1F|nr:hypothetical protein [Vibrio vulnificus]RZR39134.1 hypothetical protein D8T58_23335 [Vibrio vulnificus]